MKMFPGCNSPRGKSSSDSESQQQHTWIPSSTLHPSATKIASVLKTQSPHKNMDLQTDL